MITAYGKTGNNRSRFLLSDSHSAVVPVVLCTAAGIALSTFCHLRIAGVDLRIGDVGLNRRIHGG